MKDTTQKTATFLRQLALTLIVALLVATQSARAQDDSESEETSDDCPPLEFNVGYGNLDYNGMYQPLYSFDDQSNVGLTISFRAEGAVNDYDEYGRLCAREVGKYTVNVDVTDECGGGTATSFDVYILQAENSIKTEPTPASGLVYNGEAHPLLTEEAEAQFGAVLYSLDQANWTEDVPTATDPGKYTVYYRVVETDNYKGVEGSVEVTIFEKHNEFTQTPEAINTVYDGNEHELLTQEAVAKFGEVKYRLEGEENWYSFDELPKKTDAGEYVIHYMVEGNDIEYDALTNQVTAKIAKAPNEYVEAPENRTLKFNGEVQSLVDDVNAEGGTVTYALQNGYEELDYSKQIPTAILPGEYTVYYKVDGDDNYEGIAEQSVTITIQGWGSDNGADGSADHPYIIIDNEDLDLLSMVSKIGRLDGLKGKQFKLNNDIAYYYQSNWDDANSEENNFTPISDFNGFFDGNGKNISGIRIYEEKGDGVLFNQGLFRIIGEFGTVQNVNLSDTRITGKVSGTVYLVIGGIAGSNNQKSIISGCTVANDVAINAVSDIILIGGIVGNNNGEVSGCASSATFTANFSSDNGYILSVGGVVGQNDGTLKNNRANGVKFPVLSGEYVGGGAIAGLWYGGKLENNFYSSCSVGEKVVTTGIGIGAQGEGENIIVENKDVEENNGAVPATVVITADEGISISPKEGITTDAQGKCIAISGTTVVIEIEDAVQGAQLYAYSDFEYLYKQDDGSYTFTVPLSDVKISRAVDVWGIGEGRNGSKEHPYLIKTPDELDRLAAGVNAGNTFAGKYFELGNDIEYTYLTAWNDATSTENNFTAIGIYSDEESDRRDFCGILDGKGYSISGIRISEAVEKGARTGLFQSIGKGGEVLNVKLSDARITCYGGDSEAVVVGGIASYNNSGTIRGCTVANDVLINNACSNVGVVGLGGIVYQNTGEVSDCKSSATFTISGECKYQAYIGGIVAVNNGILSDNIADGVTMPDLSENGFYCGVIAGMIYIAGMIDTDSPLKNNFYANCTAGEAVVPSGIGVGCIISNDLVEPTTTDIPDKNGAMPAWGIGKDRDGSEGHPYLITTTIELDLLAARVNAGNDFDKTYFELGNDIEYTYSTESNNGASTENNFTAIGNDSKQFNGTFNGANYTISGIRINMPSGNFQGLFGYIGSRANVHDVNLDDVEIHAERHVGGIAGYNNGGTISNCTSNAKVSASLLLCGGIAGFNGGGTISNCTSNADVSGSMSVGGIAGANDNLGTIKNCTSSATVSSNPGQGCGGISGTNSGSLSGNLVINATISGQSYVGAINGATGGTYSHNYYYNCKVNGVENATNVGCNGKDIDNTDNPDGAMPADFIIDGDSKEAVVVSDTKENQTVAFRRSFKTGITATVILPFSFKASDYFEDKGTFHTLDEVSYNNETSQWEATPSEAIEAIEANNPYIFKPLADFDFVVFKGVKVEKNIGISKASSEIEISVETNAENWNLVGVYTNKTWYARTPNEYGFAAKQISYTDKETKEEVNITAGEFVRAGANAKMKPTRAYLRYEGENVVLNPGIQSKSAAELPDRIVLIFPDETASVIDNPSDDPSDSGDVTTPTSELVNPAVSAKVWAYDKTIFIAAAPNTAYRIIDANGRLLKESATQTDRDEIRLGSRSGIVIVIIGGKAYKVNY